MSRIFHHTCGLHQWHDVALLMKTAGVVENSGHCIYSIGLKCFLNCLSLFHLVFYLLQSNTRYFVNLLERFTYHYVYIYICYCRTFYVSLCIYIYVTVERFTSRVFYILCVCTYFELLPCYKLITSNFDGLIKFTVCKCISVL